MNNASSYCSFLVNDEYFVASSLDNQILSYLTILEDYFSISSCSISYGSFSYLAEPEEDKY